MVTGIGNYLCKSMQKFGEIIKLVSLTGSKIFAKKGTVHPVSFSASALTTMERKYSQIERECWSQREHSKTLVIIYAWQFAK